MNILNLATNTSYVVGIVNGYKKNDFMPLKNDIKYGALSLSSFAMFMRIVPFNNLTLKTTGVTLGITAVSIGSLFYLGTFTGRAIKYLKLN